MNRNDTDRIRLLVVDDSAMVRKKIPEALRTEQDIEVVGTAVDPYHARDLIVELEPDIITLDIEMPRMDGLTFLKILMEKHPMPVIILSSLTKRGSRQAVDALRLGAVDVLSKPTTAFSLGETGRILGDRIREVMAAQRQRPQIVHRQRQPVTHAPGPNLAVKGVSPGTWNRRQIGLIGASTGGTEAIRALLKMLPANLPGLCLVQHIPAFISGAFADRLNEETGWQVREARNGDVVQPGLALLAPGDYHLTISWEGAFYRCHLKQGPKVWYQRPAVDVLFKSAAPHVGDWAVAALLTGMGRDGAEGMAALRAGGSRNIAQNEETCVVYGMPKAAVDAGVVDEELPLDQIATRMASAFLARLNRKT